MCVCDVYSVTREGKTGAFCVQERESVVVEKPVEEKENTVKNAGDKSTSTNLAAPPVCVLQRV